MWYERRSRRCKVIVVSRCWGGRTYTIPGILFHFMSDKFLIASTAVLKIPYWLACMLHAYRNHNMPPWLLDNTWYDDRTYTCCTRGVNEVM